MFEICKHIGFFCLLGQPSPGSCQSIPVPLLMVNDGVRIGIDLHFFVNCILRRRRRPTSTSCMHFAEVSTTSASCEDDRGDLDSLHGYSKQSPTQTPPIRPRLIPSHSLNARSTWNQFFKQLSFFSRPVCFLSFESTIRITTNHPPARDHNRNKHDDRSVALLPPCGRWNPRHALRFEARSYAVGSWLSFFHFSFGEHFIS